MTNNETVSDIVIDLRREPLAENGAKPWLHYLADRIDVAHKREMEAKDAEIEKLNEKLTLHDCWADEECEDADAARTCAELEANELRSLVKELADIVDGPLCHQDCAKCPPDTKCTSKRLRALVANAREAIGGGK